MFYVCQGPPIREKSWKSWRPTFRFWKSQAIFLEVPIFSALIIRVHAPILNHITKRKCVILFHLWYVDTTKNVDLYIESLLAYCIISQFITTFNSNK